MFIRAESGRIVNADHIAAMETMPAEEIRLCFGGVNRWVYHNMPTEGMALVGYGTDGHPIWLTSGHDEEICQAIEEYLAQAFTRDDTFFDIQQMLEFYRSKTNEN